jgi:N-acetylglucosamine kinase-like BadF-type ATPase
VSECYLGVDGGQSSTKAWIGDDTGRVVGKGAAGPCGHVGAVGGREQFVVALSGCVEAACRSAGLEVSKVEFAAAALGFSGGAADKDALVREAVRARTYSITHDALIALVGATGGEAGIIVIAGTGSIAFGRNASGRTARAGGWGYLFGDEGGAFDLVRQALRAALRHEEGWGPPTVLRDLLLEATKLPDTNSLMHRFYTSDYPRDRVAGLAGLLETAALGGDPAAIEILHRAGQQLAELAAAVRGQLFPAGETATVSCAGGVFKNSFVRERFAALVALTDGNRFSPPEHEPVAGALLEAYRLSQKPLRLK